MADGRALSGSDARTGGSFSGHFVYPELELVMCVFV